MFCGLCIALTVHVALGIVIRGDVSDSRYVVDPSQYPAVAALRDAPNDVGCATTLIAPRFAILAAHCLCHAPTKPSGWPPIIFAGKSYKVGNTYVRSSGCVFSCKKDGPNKCDVGLIEFTSEVVGVMPVPVYNRSDELGKTIRMVGWGVTGKAGHVSAKDCDGGKEDGKFRHAENVVTKAHGVLSYLMDKPEDGALPLEGICAAGDSGGPAFLDHNNVTYIAGVNSGNNDKNGCKYGSDDEFNRLSEQYDWIQSIISGTAADNFISV